MCAYKKICAYNKTPPIFEILRYDDLCVLTKCIFVIIINY